MGDYYDDFNDYSNGNLIGQNGWSVAYRYCNPDGGAERQQYLILGDADKYVESYLKSWGLYSSQLIVKKSVSFTSSKLILSGLISARFTLSGWVGIYLRDSSDQIMMGIMLKNDSSKRTCVMTNTGYIQFCSFDPNVEYSFYLEYNTLTGVYEKITFNDVDYSSITGSTVGNSVNHVALDTKVVQQNQKETWGTFDNIFVGGYEKKKKYLMFPRWQKTKYGLRPFY